MSEDRLLLVTTFTLFDCDFISMCFVRDFLISEIVEYISMHYCKQLIVEKPNCLLTESCICISCRLRPDCLVQKCFGEMLSLTAITHCVSSSSDSLRRRGMQLSLCHAMTQLPSQQQPKRTPCNFFLVKMSTKPQRVKSQLKNVANISFGNLWNHRLSVSVSETVAKKSSSSRLQCRWRSVCVCLALYERLSPYKMNSEPRGRCLIINIANFDKGDIPLQPRPGADKDAGQFCTFSSSIFSARHMYSAVYAMARCLSVCHKPVFCQHSWTDQACFRYTGFPWHILHSVMRQCRYLQQ